jgi:hypothetical protein
MSDKIELTTEQKLKLAQKALLSVTRRIQNCKEIGYHMGAGTATFEYVTGALAAINGQPVDEVRENTVKGSASISASIEELLETL